jgi:hypothetical protein
MLPPIFVTVLQVTLIIFPITGSVIIAYLSAFRQGQKYSAMRTGAEEVKKEIYLYRTVMQSYPNRRKWLSNRLTEIQRQVHRNSGGDVVVKPYKGVHHNPYFDPNANDPCDEGIVDLNAGEYIKLRVEDQLNWHKRRIQIYQDMRSRFIIMILILEVIGALLASIDYLLNGIAIWDALSTAFAIAIINWKELLGLDMIVANYSKVILELNITRDQWTNREPHERTQADFYKLVRRTEGLLWSQNSHFISAMRESFEDADTEAQTIMVEMIALFQEALGTVQEQIIYVARRSMEEVASAAQPSIDELSWDEERLPAGTIFNAALGPVESVIVADGHVDAPAGFEEIEAS